LEVSEPTTENNDIYVIVKFTVRNTGNTPGSEIAQIYISWPSSSALTHPPLTLKAFSKVFLEVGATRSVEVHLDKYAVSSWHEDLERWVVEKGSYVISIGPSSQVLPLTARMTVWTGFEWTGL
jgi:beta-glucosidase